MHSFGYQCTCVVLAVLRASASIATEYKEYSEPTLFLPACTSKHALFPNECIALTGLKRALTPATTAKFASYFCRFLCFVLGKELIRKEIQSLRRLVTTGVQGTESSRTLGLLCVRARMHRQCLAPPKHTVVPGFALHENTCLYEQVLPASPASPAERERERERER
jgi:hypothetical protein